MSTMTAPSDKAPDESLEAILPRVRKIEIRGRTFSIREFVARQTPAIQKDLMRAFRAMAGEYQLADETESLVAIVSVATGTPSSDWQDAPLAVLYELAHEVLDLNMDFFVHRGEMMAMLVAGPAGDGSTASATSSGADTPTR